MYTELLWSSLGIKPTGPGSTVTRDACFLTVKLYSTLTSTPLGIFLLWKGCCTTSSVRVIWSRHGWSYIAGTIKLLASVWDVKDLDKASIFNEVGKRTTWKQPPVSGLHGCFPTLLCFKSQRPFSRLIFMHSLLQCTLNSLYSLVSPDWTIVKWKKNCSGWSCGPQPHEHITYNCQL